MGLDSEVLAAAGSRVATMDTARAAYSAAGLDADTAQAHGLPGPAEVQGEGRSPKGGEPFQLFGKGRQPVLVFPYHNPLGQIVDLARRRHPRGAARRCVSACAAPTTVVCRACPTAAGTGSGSKPRPRSF